jgi:hypothetical protein
MADSLLLCRLFELLGGSNPSQLPQCAGAIFNLGEAYDFGTPQPVIDFTIQMMGDGERPSGHRYSNRSMSIPVTIRVYGTGPGGQPTAADRLTLTSAREALMQAVNVDSFELVWSPDGTDTSRETVFDCWHSKAIVVNANYKAEKQLTMTLMISFEAYPWGRSDVTSHIAFDSPILDASQQPVYQLQDFGTGSNGTALTTLNTAATFNFPFETPFTAVTLGSTATATFDNAPVSHGTLSCLCSTGASNQSVKLIWGAPGSAPTQWFRLYVNLNAAPGATATLMTVQTAGAATIANLKLTTGRLLQMDAGASTNVIATTNPIPLNQWVRIEGYVTGDGSIGQVSMSLFLSMDSATPVETQTSAATFNTNGVPASYQFGIINAGAGVSWNYNLDAIAVSTAGVIGPYQLFGSGGNFYTQVTLDDYSTVSSTTQPTWWSQTTTTAAFSFSARWNHDISDKASPLWYSHVLGAATDITNRDKLSFWLGMGVPSSDWRLWNKGLTHFSVTLTDSSGHSLVFGFQQVCHASNNPSFPFWNRLSVKIPQGDKLFRYESVASYQVKAWSEQQVKVAGKFLHFKTGGYLAGLIATPTAGPKRSVSDRGGDYVLYGIEGTAPTPLSLHCQLGFKSYVSSTQSFNLPGTPGNAYNWIAPAANPNWLSSDSADFDEHGSIGDWIGSDGIATNAVLTNSSAQAHSLPSSMSVVPSSGGSNAVAASFPASSVTSLGVPCQPGDRIALSGWARAAATPRTVTLGAQFFTSGGAAVSLVNIGGVTDSTSVWTFISGRVTAPATAAFCRMIVTITTPATSEIHYLDDLYLSWGLQGTVLGTGGGGSGGTCQPTRCAGGGGGGAETAWELNLDLTPSGPHAYTIGAGGVPNNTLASGGNGGTTTFAGTTTTVTAHGGTGGVNRLTTDYSNGVGGAGGSGSGNAHHNSGGTGGTGNQASIFGGGGAGAAGDGGVGPNGGTAPVNGLGGVAGSLGVVGGAGGPGQQHGGGSGYPGYFPGGGGGAAAVTNKGYFGAKGAQGNIKMVLTTYSTQGNFPTLLVHMPSRKSTVNNLAQTVISVGGGGDPPDGREYQIGTVDGFNARYNGTFTVYAVNQSWDGSGARSVTATIRQYEQAGGAVSQAAVNQSVTPANVLNGIVNLGQVTLPVKDMAQDNTDTYYTVSLLSGDTSDRFLDLLLVDSSGQLVLINLPGGGYTDYWIDAPGLSTRIGRVLGSVADRSAAVSVLSATDSSGGPLMLEPGVNQFTVYSPSGQPGIDGEYIPHWWMERLY